jgi:hypothetical protein
MSWEDTMRRVLLPAGGVPPHTTSRYGATTDRPRSSTNPHRGVGDKRSWFDWAVNVSAGLSWSDDFLRSNLGRRSVLLAKGGE